MYLEFAKEIVIEAGKYAEKFYYGTDASYEYKSAKDLVTECDKTVEKMLSDRILNSYPNHSILGEESGGQNGGNQYEWIIDPIDGTSNFAHRLPLFAITISLQKNSKTILGVTYNPITKEMFSAELGKGAFFKRGDMPETKIRVSDRKVLSEVIASTGSHPIDEEMIKINLQQTGNLTRKVRAMRRLGAASLHLAYTASGFIDLYWEFNLKPWDVSAGILLVKEAGGKITEIDGSPYILKKSKSILATNSHVHSDGIKELSRIT